MIVTRGTLVKEFLFRYRSQIALVTLCVFMIVLGIIYRIQYKDYDGMEDYRFKFYVAYTVLTLTGFIGIAASILLKRGTVSGGMIIFGLTIFFIFVAAGSYVNGMDEDMEEYGFMVRLAMYILLAFVVVFSIKIMIGSTVNTSRVIWLLGILVGIFLLQYIVDLHHNISTADSLAGKSDYIGVFIISVVTIILLGYSDTKYVGPMKRLRLNVEALEATEITFDRTYMLRSSLRSLMESREQWDRSVDGSKRELVIQLYNRIRRDEMVVKEWYDGTLVCTVIPKSRRFQLYRGFTFPIRHIAIGDLETTDLIRIYGDNGFFIELTIRDTHIKRYRSLREVKAIFQFWKE